MRVSVHPGRCNGCESCAIYCPEVFKIMPNNKTFCWVAVDEVPEHLVDAVRKAEAACPARAIESDEKSRRK